MCTPRHNSVTAEPFVKTVRPVTTKPGTTHPILSKDTDNDDDYDGNNIMMVNY